MDGRIPVPYTRVSPECLHGIKTPLVVGEWVTFQRHHPDEYRDYLVRDMNEGFRIGFRYASHVCKQAGSNMKSATDPPEVIDKHRADGRVVALDREALLACQASRVRVKSQTREVTPDSGHVSP